MLKPLTLALRFLMELCALAALGVWGMHQGSASLHHWALALGIPLLAALFWGSFVSPRARFGGSRRRRLLLGLVVLLPAALAVGVLAGAWAGGGFGAFALLNTWLTYRLGPQPGETSSD